MEDATMKRFLMALGALMLVAAPLAAQSTAFDRAVREADVKRQRTLAKIREELDAVEGSLAGSRFTEASLRVMGARRLLALSDEILPEEKRVLRAEIDRVATVLSARRAAVMAERQAKAQVEVSEQETRRIKDAKTFERRQIESHWARLDQFRERGQYERALTQAGALLKKRPGDNKALLAKWDMEYLSGLSSQLRTRGLRRGETQLVLAETEEAGVPYYELMRFGDPKAWEQMSIRRLTRMARQMGYETDTGASRVLLQKRIDLTVNDIGLPSVLTYLSEAGGVPIILDPHIEADTSLAPADQVVTFDGKQLTLQQLLDIILPSEYGWRFSEGQVIVSSPEKANPQKMITYAIQHLVAAIPDFGDTVPRMTLSAQPGDGDGDNPFEGMDDEVAADPPEQKIIELLKRFVKGKHVGIWEDEGGTATIMYYNGTLIVSQTDEGHRKVASLLGRL
jgi:hypothetical protein